MYRDRLGYGTHAIITCHAIRVAPRVHYINKNLLCFVRSYTLPTYLTHSPPPPSPISVHPTSRSRPTHAHHSSNWHLGAGLPVPTNVFHSEGFGSVLGGFRLAREMAAACEQRVNLDGEVIKPLKICMIGAGGFIGSHLCENLMWGTEHSVLAIDVYGDKIQHLLQPGQKWSNRIEFHKINIKSDSRLEGLIKVSDLVK